MEEVQQHLFSTQKEDFCFFFFFPSFLHPPSSSSGLNPSRRRSFFHFLSTPSWDFASTADEGGYGDLIPFSLSLSPSWQSNPSCLHKHNCQPNNDYKHVDVSSYSLSISLSWKYLPHTQMYSTYIDIYTQKGEKKSQKMWLFFPSRSSREKRARISPFFLLAFPS